MLDKRYKKIQHGYLFEISSCLTSLLIITKLSYCKYCIVRCITVNRHSQYIERVHNWKAERNLPCSDSANSAVHDTSISAGIRRKWQWYVCTHERLHKQPHGSQEESDVSLCGTNPEKRTGEAPGRSTLVMSIGVLAFLPEPECYLALWFVKTRKTMLNLLNV